MGFKIRIHLLCPQQEPELHFSEGTPELLRGNSTELSALSAKKKYLLCVPAPQSLAVQEEKRVSHKVLNVILVSTRSHR